jgi:hypothetical protein
MITNNFIPEFVFWINILILVINLWNLGILFYKFHYCEEEKKVFVLVLLLNATSMLSVNIPAAIQHYMLYFSSNLNIPTEATWLRFWDRYSMVFKSIFSAMMTSDYCIAWMRKFYIKSYHIKH